MENFSNQDISLSENDKFNNYSDEDEEIRIARENLEKIKSLTDYEQIKYCTNLDADSAKKLFNLINNKQSFLGSKVKRPKSEAILNSKKPLWIDEVKKTCLELMPKIDINEFEHSKNILSQDEMDEHLCDPEEYPYYQTIKKLLYAFGDCYKNNPRTIIYMHDFIKKWLILIIKIISECEFKKIMEHLYSYEYSKFFNYKKLKLRNCLKADIDEVDHVKNVHSDSNKKLKKKNDDSDDEEIDLSSKLEDKNALGNINLDLNLDIDELNNINENPGLNLILDENVLGINSEDESVEAEVKKNEGKESNLIKSIFDIQDEFYEENLAFQDFRTQRMNEAEYLEYINCRIQGFLTRGKKLFLNYLQNIIVSANLFKSSNKTPKANYFNSNNSNKLVKNNTNISNLNYSINNINDEDLIENQKIENSFYGNNLNLSDKYMRNNNMDTSYNVPYELKDQGNLELICFILKEIMNKIVKNAIKLGNPERKLILLKYPLSVEDIEHFALQELDKLEQFLSDYSVSIYLMKEFKKKKFCKLNNKNVKIKKSKNSFFVIVKKYIFLEAKEADTLRKNRKSMEERVSNQFKYLLAELNKQANLKKKRTPTGKTKEKNNPLKKEENGDLIVLEEERNLLKEIDKKFLLNHLNIKHYYEYFLLKDVLKEVDERKFSINFLKLKKITKKYFTKKFEMWINMDELDRLFYKNEFNNILGIKDKENEVI